MLPLDHFSSLGDALAEAVIRHKSETLFAEVDRRRRARAWTGADFGRRAIGWCSRLLNWGLSPGDRCAIIASNRPDWSVAAIGALWAGAVLVPLDYKLSAPELCALIDHCGPRVLVAESAILKRMLALRPEIVETMRVVAIDAAEVESQNVASWEETEVVDTCVARPVPRQRDDIATIVYSSGTAGTPKGCMLTHGNYLVQAQTLGAMYPMHPGDAYFSVLPTNHAIDFMCGLLMPVLFGGTIVHQRSLRPAYFSWTIREMGITHMAVVPRLLTVLEERVREELDRASPLQRTIFDTLRDINAQLTWREPNHRLSSTLLRPVHRAFGGRLRLLFCGGAFTPPASARFFYDLGIPVVIGYGLTEAGTVLTLNDLHPFREDTVGKPLDGVELEIRDGGADGIGEVWVRSETVMHGYLDAPDLTHQTIVDGWLRTGDLGRVDPAGHLQLVGRVRNMIVTKGGKNVYPEDVESLMGPVDGVDELSVFSSEFLWQAQRLGAESLLVVAKPSEDADDASIERGLARACRALPEHKRPNTWLRWDEPFPRTASLKVQRDALADAVRRTSTPERTRAVS